MRIARSCIGCGIRIRLWSTRSRCSRRSLSGFLLRSGRNCIGRSIRCRLFVFSSRYLRRSSRVLSLRSSHQRVVRAGHSSIGSGSCILRSTRSSTRRATIPRSDRTDDWSIQRSVGLCSAWSPLNRWWEAQPQICCLEQR